MGRFSEDELRRYSRQMLLREVGGHGQERLRAAAPTLFAAGPEGLVAARYLLRAGVLRLRVESPADPAALAGALAADLPPGFRGAFAAAAPWDALAPAGLTRLSLPPLPALWAWQDGAAGEVGRGCPCVAGLPPGAASPSPLAPAGPLPFLVGAALALAAVQLLCGVAGAPLSGPGPRPGDDTASLLRFGAGEPAPAALPCRCGKNGGSP